MPLRALIDGNDIHAYGYTEAEWDLLKKSYKASSLRMACCGNLAIPKTSKLGTFFFAHKQKGECFSAPESVEHIFLKSLIARAATDAGWIVTTECSGCSSAGEKWVADVLCKKGSATVAFEIQLSSIPYREISERTERYKRSNVRSAWFVDAKKFKDWKSKSQKTLPIFGVSQIGISKLPTVEHFNEPAELFVKALLNKKIQWIVEPWVYIILYIEDNCWKCDKPVKQIYGSAIDVYSESAKTVPNASNILETLSSSFSNTKLNSLGLNSIGKNDKIKGNAPGYSYCNMCIHCGAPQSNYYLMEHLKLHDRAFGNVDCISEREGSGSWVWAP